MATLEQIARNINGNVHVHIIDTAFTDKTLTDVHPFLCDSIKYFRTAGGLSMSENHSHGIDTVTSEWLTILGDDDALVDGSLAIIIEMLKHEDTYALRTQRWSYLWPDATESGRGSLTMERPPAVRLGINSAKKLMKAGRIVSEVLAGARSYTELPVIYNGGFVRTRAVQSLPRIKGCLLPAPIPDLYSGFALAMAHGDYSFWREPIVINGASVHSLGRAQFGTTRPSDDKKIRDGFRESIRFPFPHLAEGSHPPSSIQYFIYASFKAGLALGLPGAQLDPGLLYVAKLVERKDVNRPHVAEWIDSVARSSKKEPTDAQKVAAKRLTWLRRRSIPRRLLMLVRKKVFGSTVWHQPQSALSDVSRAALFARDIYNLRLPKQVQRRNDF